MIPTDDEVRVVADIWIAAYAPPIEQGSAMLRRTIVAGVRLVLADPTIGVADDRSRAARAILAAYRAGRATGA